jgi:hypothetical protein
VRRLIVLVLLVGGWLGWIVRGARVQHQAAAAIRRAGGAAIYNWHYKDGEYDPFARPGWPEWLVSRLGEDYFGHVNSVNLYDLTRILDEEPRTDYEERVFRAALAQIGNLSRLEELDIEDIDAGDAALASPGLFTS